MLKKKLDVLGYGDITSEVPNKCPICGANIVPSIVAVVKNNRLFSDNSLNFSAALACPACHKMFVAIIDESVDSQGTYHLLSVTPQNPSVYDFDPAMSIISAQFVEIYHQAEAAEVYSLDQIAGIGFRKALEFLIKDYTILLHPAQSDEIKETRLAKCIEKYIDHPKIQATAKVATWIGNDETHYIRKWETKDINDLKKFISACVYWILSDNAYREAEEMTTP